MEQLTIDELYTKITEWAEARNLIKGSDPKSQTLKFFSELGELFAARRGTKEGMTEQIDAIGDCAVVLTILAKQYDFDIHKIHNFTGTFAQGKNIRHRR